MTDKKIPIGDFVEENIIAINNGISTFKKKDGYPYDDTDIKNYLINRYQAFSEEKKQQIFDEFVENKYSKQSITNIANKYTLYKIHLENAFTNILLLKYQNKLTKTIYNNILNTISKDMNIDNHEFSYIRSTLRNSLQKFLFLTMQNGFTTNINNLNTGVMATNAGDSAQFLFLSRAILAGYNCSNVDVRSSRYDAIIDYKDMLFRIQIKGISGTSINFKDRPRGGRGSDYKNVRNLGKYITIEDCDLYVAVDKQSGICYIIPTKDIPSIDPTQKGTINIKDAEKYKENWEIIKRLSEEIDQ